MSRLGLATALSLFLHAQTAFAGFLPDIVGKWQYDGFLFEEHRYPPTDPNLQVLFTFNADLTGRLYWYRTNEPGFCERTSTYELTGDVLKQTVTWVNPSNDVSCSKDPDMQLGRTTQNEIDLGMRELGIHMELNSKPLIYILKRL